MATNDLVLRVSANVGRLIANLQKAGAAVKRFSGQTASAGAAATTASTAIAATGKSAASMTKISAASQTASGALNKLAAASARVSSALKPAATSVSNFGNRFKKFAADTTIGREAINAYGVTAASLSAKVKAGQAALKKLSTAMKKAGTSAVAAGSQIKAMATAAVQSAGKTKAAQMAMKGFSTVSAKLSTSLTKAKASFADFGAKAAALSAKVGVTRASLAKFGNGFIKLAAKAKAGGAALLKAGSNALKSSPMYLGMVAALKGAGAGFIKLAAKAKAAGTAMKAAGMSAMMAGGIILAVLAPLIITGAKFQQSMADAFAVIGDSSDLDGTVSNMEKLENTAKNLGKSTEFTATQVGSAFKFMGMAGMNTTEIMKGVKPVLALATAGNMELGAATDSATDTMTAFGMQAQDLGRVVDVMSKTALSSNTNLQQMGDALKYVSSAARGSGISLEETSVAIGMLGNAGIKGSMAGTSLRMSIIKLSEVTDKGTEVLSAYGLTYDDINPKVHGLKGAIAALAKAGVQSQDIFAMFGARAGNSMNALIQNFEKFDDLQEKVMDNFGSAASMQATKLNTLGGEWKLFVSAVQGFSLSVFEAVADDLQKLVSGFRQVALAAEAWTQENQGLTNSIMKMVGGLGAFLLLGGALAATMGMVSSIFGTLAGGVGKFAILLKPLGVAVVGFLAGLTAVKAIIVALVAVVTGVLIATLISARTMFDNLARAVGTLYDATIGKFIKGITEGFSRMGEELGPIMAKSGAAFEKIGVAIEYLADLMASFLGPAFEGLGKTIANIGLDIIVGTFAFIADAAEVLAEKIEWLVDQWIYYGKKLKLIDKDTLTVAERNAKLAKEFEAIADTVIMTADEFKEYNKALRENGVKLGRIIDLGSGFDKLTVGQMETLKKLRGEYGNVGIAIQAWIDQADQDIQKKKDAIKYGNLSVSAMKATKVQLKDLESQRERLIQSQDQYNTAIAKEGQVLGLTTAQLDARIAKQKEENAVAATLKTAHENHVSNMTKMKEIEEELADDDTLANKWAEQIRLLEEEAEARKVNLEAIRTELKLEYEAAKVKGDLSQDEIDHWEESIQRTDDLIAKNDEYTQSKIDGVKKTREAEQQAYENQQAIDAANRRGDTVGAAKLTAQAKFDAEKEKIDELYDLTDAQQREAHGVAMGHIEEERDASIQAAQEAGDAQVQDQMQAADDERGDQIKDIIKGEREVLNAKIGQARNVQTILNLEKARMAIEDARFARVKASIDEAEKKERAIQAIREKMDATNDPAEKAKLEQLLSKREGELAFWREKAETQGVQAGMQLGDNNIAKLEDQKLKIQQLLEEVLEFKAATQTRLNELVAVFSTGGSRMASAIYRSAEGGGFAATFPATRDQINAALNGWTPQVQTWADGFALVFENLAASVEADLQRIHTALNAQGAALGSGSGSSGSGSTTIINNNHGGNAGSSGGVSNP